MIEPIPLGASGATVGEAIRSLCLGLADFVMGHRKTIEEQRSLARRIADPQPGQEQGVAKECMGDRNVVQASTPAADYPLEAYLTADGGWYWADGGPKRTVRYVRAP